MADIVESLTMRSIALRSVARQTATTKYDAELSAEAAAEIERLRNELEQAREVVVDKATAWDAAQNSYHKGYCSGLEFANAEIESLRREVARCHARLEIDHYFVASGEGEFTRVEIPMDERQDWHDGIECRDATISLLEADLVKYRGVKP